MSNNLLKGWSTVQEDITSDKLTFMQPRRLARSMTRNFLMRSLGKKEKHSVNPGWFFLFGLLSFCLSLFQRKRAWHFSMTGYEMTSASSPKVTWQPVEGWWVLAEQVVSLWQSLNQRVLALFCLYRDYKLARVMQPFREKEIRMIHRGLSVSSLRKCDSCWRTESFWWRSRISHPRSCWQFHKYGGWMLFSLLKDGPLEW